jgi:DNA-binding NarL/FixJ family response regulator
MSSALVATRTGCFERCRKARRGASVLIDKSVTFCRSLEDGGMAQGKAVAIVLDDADKRELTALTRKHGTGQVIAERARIVLAAASGLKNKEISAKLGVCAHTVGTGVTASLRSAWMVSMTSRVRELRARSATRRLRR